MTGPTETKGVQITITVSDKHADAIMRCDFDGHCAPGDVTTLKDRLEWLVESWCDQTLLDEAHDKLLFYKRMLEQRDNEPK